MDTNQDILQGQWPTLKGQVKQQWGNLTDDDVRQTQRHDSRPGQCLAAALRLRQGPGGNRN